MAIKIGDVYTVGRVTDWTVVPDDRQSLVQLVDSPYNMAIDNGYHENGNRYTFTCILSAADWATVKSYWISRTLITVINEDGETLTNCRVRITTYKARESFWTSYEDVGIELWRV